MKDYMGLCLHFFLFLFSSPFLSSSPTATPLTDAMSESIPLFFFSDFREEIFAMWTLNLPI